MFQSKLIFVTIFHQNANKFLFYVNVIDKNGFLNPVGISCWFMSAWFNYRSAGLDKIFKAREPSRHWLLYVCYSRHFQAQAYPSVVM